MKNLMSKFLKEEEGNVIEYVIVIAVVAVIIVALFPGLRSKIVGWFNSAIGNVDTGLNNSSLSGQKCINKDGVNSTYGTDGVCK